MQLMNVSLHSWEVLIVLQSQSINHQLEFRATIRAGKELRIPGLIYSTCETRSWVWFSSAPQSASMAAILIIKPFGGLISLNQAPFTLVCYKAYKQVAKRIN